MAERPEPIKEILIEDNGPPRKGECEAEAKNEGKNTCGKPQRSQNSQEGEDKLPSQSRQESTSKKRKVINQWEPQKQRGNRPDYKHLNDPFDSKEDEEKWLTETRNDENLITELLIAEVDDEFHSLKEVRE